MENNNNRKTKEQRIWELRKMQMAGIQVDKTKITLLDEPLINLSYRTNLFLNHKYYISGIEKVIDTKSEMYAIGNKESKYYDSLKDTIDVFNGNIHVINPINEDIFRKNTQQEFKTLPVYRLKNEFLQFYKDNSIMVITGETGCGKSTLVPKLIYDNFGHRIAITQPRRVAVKSLFERMKGFYKDEVGYAMKFDSRLTSKTKIKFMTEGVLLKEIAKDEDLGMYDTIILDEAHERSVNMDILLALLKRISKKRPNLKIIIMSATIIISKFVDFFNCKSFTFDGKQFPVDINYLEVDVDDYIEWTVKKTISLVHSDDNKGDILVFLSGKDDVDKTFRLLCNFLNCSKQHLAIIKCYSEILNDVYQHIFTNDSATKKIILSTNVSEASVTIPNIKYVIDSGFHKLVVHDYSQGEVLIRCPISKENAIQRAGRCGRTSKGICFRMYTKKTFDKLVDCTPPEIIRSDLSNILLHLVDLNVSDISKIHLMDTPSYELVESCYDFLILLGALDDARKMTQLGRTIIDLGCDCSPRVPHKGLSKEKYKKIELLVFNEWKKINNNFIFERNLEIWRQFWLTCEKADVVVQIVDARNPLFFVNRDIAVMYPNKRHLLLANKADLTTRRCDLNEFDVFYYSAIGENTVLDFLYRLDCSSIGFIGYPNVGKSSTINAIIKDKRVRVSQTPGKTKHIQTIKIADSKYLIDCPGLVFPKHSKTNLLLHGILNIDTILDLKSSLYEIIKFIGIVKLNTYYHLPPFENDSRYPIEINFINNMADVRQWSITTCLKNIIKDLCNGKIQYERIEEELNIKSSFKWMK